jgi:hypothetical protein
VDVLRQKGMAGFDTQDRVPDHFSWSGQQSSIFSQDDEENDQFHEKLMDHILAGTPSHLSMRLRAKIKLDNSPGGRSWDVFQVLVAS